MFTNLFCLLKLHCFWKRFQTLPVNTLVHINYCWLQQAAEQKVKVVLVFAKIKTNYCNMFLCIFWYLVVSAKQTIHRFIRQFKEGSSVMEGKHPHAPSVCNSENTENLRIAMLCSVSKSTGSRTGDIMVFSSAYVSMQDYHDAQTR